MDTAALIEFTQALVRVPSVNYAGRREEPAADLVAGLMRSWGWTPVIEPVAPGRPNVHAVLEGDRPGPTLLFGGHTDVVTEGSGWSVDPFGAQIRDGRLYGRGSADMKGGLAAMLFAAREVQTGGFAGRIVVAAFADEEGMMLGSKHFAARHAAGIDGAIVCEPEAEEICLTAKGALRLRIDAHGAMAHGAMPEHGRNPLPVLGRVLAELGRLQERMQAEAGVDEHLGRPYLTPTVLRAGDPDQLNVIPAEAWLGVDVRTVPGQDHGEIV
ncbi:MAG TPA: M20/M25/M40 family metallo-hydrolase, partial [Mycobacteriales bacterium]|nr:M20/M25/M40 family metallo-hydrolase [Mycobacteriales bacterium]